MILLNQFIVNEDVRDLQIKISQIGSSRIARARDDENIRSASLYYDCAYGSNGNRSKNYSQQYNHLSSFVWKSYSRAPRIKVEDEGELCWDYKHMII